MRSNLRTPAGSPCKNAEKQDCGSAGKGHRIEQCVVFQKEDAEDHGPGGIGNIQSLALDVPTSRIAW